MPGSVLTRGLSIDLLIDFSLCFGSALQVSDRCRSHSVKLISVDVPSLGAANYGADNETVQASLDGQILETMVIEWGNPSVNPTVELIRVLKTLPIEEKVLFVGFTIHQLLGAHDLIAQHRSSENTIMVGQNYTRQIDEIMKVLNTPLIGCVHYNPEGYGDQLTKVTPSEYRKGLDPS